MAAFMEYEGIKGSATAKGYESMIKLDHAQIPCFLLSANRAGNFPPYLDYLFLIFFSASAYIIFL